MDKKNRAKCLAVACSPRRGGNTDLLARRALEGVKAADAEGEIIYLRDYRYAPCMACDGCFKKGRCVVKDDASLVFEKILEADRVIFAAPIFSMGICAQAKMLIDRSQQFWACKYVLHRPIVEDEKKRPDRQGIFISAAGTNLPGIFDGSTRVVKYFFKMLDIQMKGFYGYPKVDRKGDILEHPDAMVEVYEAGKKLV